MSDHIISERTLGAILAKQAIMRPRQEFLVFEDQSWTYKSFDDWVTTIARGLSALGLQKGDKIAIMLQNCGEFMGLWFAAARIGAVEVPVNTAYRGPLLRHVLEQSDARVLVASTEYLSKIVPELDGLTKLDKLVLLGPIDSALRLPKPYISFDEFLRDQARLPDHDIEPDDPLAIMYSSGTTGPSKGILLCHNYFWWGGDQNRIFREVTEEDRLYTCLPLFHGNAQMLTAVPALLAGATLIIDSPFSASTFWNRLRNAHATQFNYIGGMLTILMKQPPSPGDRSHQVSLATGAAAPRDQWRSFEERFGLRILEYYGQTENCLALYNPLDATKVGSIGLPICGYDADVVDDHDRQVPPGVPGELVVRPKHPFIMMSGYYKMPEETLQMYRNLWMHTGDLVTRDADGYYYYVDRKKDAIRRRGENISAYEVELVLNMHPAVLESAAIAVPSDVGEDEVMACIVLRPDMNLDPLDLTKHCEKLLPYFAIPRFIDFQTELPKTPTHRVRKYLLRQRGVTTTTWDREASGYRLSR